MFQERNYLMVKELTNNKVLKMVSPRKKQIFKRRRKMMLMQKLKSQAKKMVIETIMQVPGCLR